MLQARNSDLKKYVVHNLLGGKILGTPWQAPVWRNRLNVFNAPIEETLEDTATSRSPQLASRWYKVEYDIGMDIGPAFRKLISIKATLV